jgi:isoleucyl-tRNA synthetase
MCEYIWQGLVREVEPNASEFVMTADFPVGVKVGERVEGVIEQVDFVKQVISLGLAVRAAGQREVKQPLRVMYIKTTRAIDLSRYIDIIKDEVNVQNVEIVQNDDRFTEAFYVVDFKKAGAVLKGDVQKLKAEVESASVGEWEEMETTGKFRGHPAEFFIKKFREKIDFSAETEGDVTVVLDINISEDLLNEGLLRKLIRSIQVARQNAGLEISSRIVLGLSAQNETLNRVIETHGKKICDEVLAVELCETVDGGHRVVVQVGDLDVVVTLKVAK